MKLILHTLACCMLINTAAAFSVVLKTTVRRYPLSLLHMTTEQQQQRSTSSSYLTALEKQTNEINNQATVANTDSTTTTTTPYVITTDMKTEDAMMKDADAVVETDKTKLLLQQVKDAGIAGVISYAVWELGFWAISVPVVLVGYYQFTGHWPDLSNTDDVAKLSAEAFAFVNFARFAVPLRIGLALSTTPWIQTNIVDRFIKKDEQKNDDSSNE